MSDSSPKPVGGMIGLDPSVGLAENYRRFAATEAAGKSPLYEELAYFVADSTPVLEFLEVLPPNQRQPNLVFSAARFLIGTPPDSVSLTKLVVDRRAELEHVLRARRTQTNEAARCAVLLPALAQLQCPLALIEVGASAGLTLLHDFYSYDYGGHVIIGRDPNAPVLSCRPSGSVPLPERMPEIVWRAGLDINPLDITSDEDLEWLLCLIWPGDDARADRLRSAAAIARKHPTPIHQGDLLEDLPRVAADAPPDATLVIFHTAVLAYVDGEKREAFGQLVAELGAVWLSNEGEGVLPDLPGDHDGKFLVVKDGTELLARADPHGSWIEWVG